MVSRENNNLKRSNLTDYKDKVEWSLL